MDKLPKKIDHDHIVDSVVEVRFVPKHEHSVVLDIATAIRDQIQNYRLVTTDIPKQFRQADPQFSFSAEVTLTGDKFSVGVGFNTIVFNCQNGYKTWEEYFPFIKSVLGKIEDKIDKILRVGVRFTNFFEGANDLKKFNIYFSSGISSGLQIDSTKVTQMVVKFSTSGFNVTVANQARVAKKALPGILVDIDAFVDNVALKNFSELYDEIENTHLKEKEMFFSLIEKSFLESLHPTY